MLLAPELLNEIFEHYRAKEASSKDWLLLCLASSMSFILGHERALDSSRLEQVYAAVLPFLYSKINGEQLKSPSFANIMAVKPHLATFVKDIEWKLVNTLPAGGPSTRKMHRDYFETGHKTQLIRMTSLLSSFSAMRDLAVNIDFRIGPTTDFPNDLPNMSQLWTALATVKLQSLSFRARVSYKTEASANAMLYNCISILRPHTLNLPDQLSNFQLLWMRPSERVSVKRIHLGALGWKYWPDLLLPGSETLEELYYDSKGNPMSSFNAIALSNQPMQRLKLLELARIHLLDSVEADPANGISVMFPVLDTLKIQFEYLFSTSRPLFWSHDALPGLVRELLPLHQEYLQLRKVHLLALGRLKDLFPNLASLGEMIQAFCCRATFPALAQLSLECTLQTYYQVDTYWGQRSEDGSDEEDMAAVSEELRVIFENISVEVPTGLEVRLVYSSDSMGRKMLNEQVVRAAPQRMEFKCVGGTAVQISRSGFLD